MSQLSATVQPRATDAAPIIHAQGIFKTFRMGDSAVQVLRGVDLSVREGEFLAIEGRSGSGKSTLLHILGGLDSTDGGKVEFEGVDYTSRGNSNGREPWLRRLSRWTLRGWIGGAIAAFAAIIASIIVFHQVSLARQQASERIWWAGVVFALVAIGLFVAWLIVLSIRAILHHIWEAPLTRMRNQQFGFVFQFYHLLPELNVLENTLLAPMIGGNATLAQENSATRRQRARQILEDLGMGHRLTHRPAQLSGGERQRVAIARALMNQPRVLFADEPTGNLDAETGQQIMSVFERLHREQRQTIIMVTHDRAIAHRADRVLVLKSGRITRPGDPEPAPVVPTLDYK
jgi:lipoprotein-releasing system ATP-binding protein